MRQKLGVKVWRGALCLSNKCFFPWISCDGCLTKPFLPGKTFSLFLQTQDPTENHNPTIENQSDSSNHLPLPDATAANNRRIEPCVLPRWATNNRPHLQPCPPLQQTNRPPLHNLVVQSSLLHGRHHHLLPKTTTSQNARSKTTRLRPPNTMYIHNQLILPIKCPAIQINSPTKTNKYHSIPVASNRPSQRGVGLRARPGPTRRNKCFSMPSNAKEKAVTRKRATWSISLPFITT